ERVGIRLFLRIQRGRYESLESDALRESEPGPDADGSELSPDDGYRGQGHRVGAASDEHRTGPAVSSVCATGSNERAAPSAEGVDRQVQREMRRRLGQIPRRNAGAAEKSGGGAERHETDGAVEGIAGVGFAECGSETAVRTDDGSVRRLRRALRLR